MEDKQDLNEQEHDVSWAEVIMEMLESPNLNERVRQFLELKTKQVESQIQEQRQYIKWTSAIQFILSALVIIGVFVLTFFDKLQGQTAATLIGAIVGYLFGRQHMKST